MENENHSELRLDELCEITDNIYRTLVDWSTNIFTTAICSQDFFNLRLIIAPDNHTSHKNARSKSFTDPSFIRFALLCKAHQFIYKFSRTVGYFTSLFQLHLLTSHIPAIKLTWNRIICQTEFVITNYIAMHNEQTRIKIVHIAYTSVQRRIRNTLISPPLLYVKSVFATGKRWNLCA